MSAVREREIQAGPLRLAAREWGGPGGERVLALHGWLDNAASFDALAPLIPDAHIVALDLPGHGRSQHRPEGSWYHYVDYPGDVLHVADALGWERFTLLGHSLGGAVASVLAAVAPGRVDALWLIEALGPPSADPAGALEQLRRAVEQRHAVGGKSRRVFPDLETAIAARRHANGLTLSDTASRLLVERGVERQDGGYRWSSDPRLTLASPIRVTEEQVLAWLGGIRCDALLMLADPPAPFLPPAMVARRVGAVANLTQVRLPGSHHLHLEDPGPVARAIAEFRAARRARPAS